MTEKEKEISEYKNKITELENKLKRYSNPDRHKRFYENNKDTIKAKAKEYMKRIKEENPEKLKQWRHNAYINRKNKLKNDNNK